MLQKITHIEGLDRYEDHLLPDDTPPGGGRAWFTVESEEMPFLTNDPVSNPRGDIIRKNFVWFHHEQELGRTAQHRRCRDRVEFDETTGKWKVLKLAPPKLSHISRFPDAWNAFARGTQSQVIGTPIQKLFQNDPSRAEMYKRFRIETIEQLENLPEGDADHIGMGARDDRAKAQRYLAKTREAVTASQFTAKVEQMEAALRSRDAQIADLTEKLTELLKAQIEEREQREARKPGRKSKQVEEQVEA